MTGTNLFQERIPRQPRLFQPRFQAAAVFSFLSGFTDSDIWVYVSAIIKTRVNKHQRIQAC
jgi:hypothetical protein